MDMTPQAWPDWYDGKHINEVLFCQQFLDKHPMKCVRGRLFTVDGLIEDEGQIGNLILEEISGVLTSGLSKVVTNLLASIKLQAYSPPLPIETDRIHVSNGTYFIDGSFTVVKSYCNNRLTVAYNPDAPTPKKWLQFLSELLQPEDIPTLQEFLGYCLLPTTKGQKMLMLIGKGGEGKSRIGLVMRSLLGDSMNTTSIQKVESNRFSRADLENKLLMVDDDMDMSALPKTNYIKSIVTSECKMDMERKGVQSYQSQLYVRFLCFGNGALTALHDKSDGFFRRQIVLTTKDRPAGRADDPFLVDKLLREKEGIFLWCLEGLHRLIGDNYQFTVSSKAKENMETVKRSSNNVIEFLQSEGYIRFRADSEASSKAIYEAYTRWCDDNAQKPMLDCISNRAYAALQAQRELPVYRYPGGYAHEHGELEQYRASRKADIACKEAIESAITEHYRDNCLGREAVSQVVEQFGYERVLHVLANTVRHKEWDGRISQGNKAWARTVPVFEDLDAWGNDRNKEFVVDRSHPGIIDLFVDMVRHEYLLTQPLTKDDIRAEAARILSAFQAARGPNSPSGTHFMVQVSPDFLARANSKNQNRLVSMLPFRSLSISTLEGRKGVYALITKDEDRAQSLRLRKPSVRKKLSETKAEPGHTDKKKVREQER